MIDALNKQITENQRRLNELYILKAKFGINTDPHIIIEIKDLEKEIPELKHKLQDKKESLNSILKLIDIHRKNIEVYLDQKSSFGSNTPAYVITQLQKERNELKRLKLICNQHDYKVADLPNDFEEIKPNLGMKNNDKDMIISEIREHLRHIDRLLSSL